MKLWDKNYILDKEIENFTVGNDYLIDKKLLKYDCIGSIAHARMLEKINILSKDECKDIIFQLKKIIELNEKKLFKIKKEDEDCHTAIEKYLIKNLGKTGKKINTARSRNDQILTALRLYYKDEIKNTEYEINKLLKTVKKFKKKYSEIEIPGYTHMKKAMPSSINIWVGYIIESFKENIKFLKFVLSYIDKSPLGTAAGYGLPIKIDRDLTSEILGFKEIQKNPLHVQNSRGKYESLILHSLIQIMYDLNKISTDILFFSIDEIDIFSIPKKYCTGSSIMPHKNNFDCIELIRAKYHLIISLENQINSVVGNLISGYNRDIQITKEPVIKAFHTTKECIKIMNLILSDLKLNKDKCKKAMNEELNATKEVYNLVKEGVSFRDAYKKIAKKYS